MEIGITILAQITILAAVCIVPVLTLGIRLMPAPARVGYVRKRLGER